jgi:hypothetical protein
MTFRRLFPKVLKNSILLQKFQVLFGDGHCLSYVWFEKEPDFFCPMTEKCGAFARKWPGGSAAIFNTPSSKPES